MDKHLKQVTCPSSSHSNNKQMCHRKKKDLQARQTWMQVVKVSGAGVSTRKHARNARTRTSMVLCAMDSKNKRLCNRNRKRVCQVFGCASMPGGPRSGSFPNLGVNPMSCHRHYGYNHHFRCQVAIRLHGYNHHFFISQPYQD